MTRTTADWEALYKERGALWIHDGNPLRPHALLTSGKHSNGFFNSELVMNRPVLLEEACEDLLNLLVRTWRPGLTEPDCIVGPAMGAITMAHDLARLIDRTRGRECCRAYTEKLVVENGVKTVMACKRTLVEPRQKVLLCEDVITSGASVEATAQAVEELGGEVLPFVLTLVNRSELTEIDDRTVISLIHHDLPIWETSRCPLCQAGSVPLRPKEADNWKRLTAMY